MLHVELGVVSWRLDADNYETDEELKKIREARGYSYMVAFFSPFVMTLCSFKKIACQGRLGPFRGPEKKIKFGPFISTISIIIKLNHPDS